MVEDLGEDLVSGEYEWMDGVKVALYRGSIGQTIRRFFAFSCFLMLFSVILGFKLGDLAPYPSRVEGEFRTPTITRYLGFERWGNFTATRGSSGVNQIQLLVERRGGFQRTPRPKISLGVRREHAGPLLYNSHCQNPPPANKYVFHRLRDLLAIPQKINRKVIGNI